MTIWRKLLQVYQRNACKSIIDDRGRAGFADLCQKKAFAAQDLRVTLQRAGNYATATICGTICVPRSRPRTDIPITFLVPLDKGNVSSENEILVP